MSPLPDYYTIWHKAGHYGLRIMAGLVLIFLMMPILVIMPLSFNAEPFFTFTQGMLSLDPDAYSTRWYHEIVDDQKWRIAIRNSFLVGIAAASIATVLGTLAAVGLASPWMPFKRVITALLLSPMIVPLIIIAAGMFFFYTQFNLVGTFTGLIIANAALGVPLSLIHLRRDRRPKQGRNLEVA